MLGALGGSAHAQQDPEATALRRQALAYRDEAIQDQQKAAQHRSAGDALKNQANQLHAQVAAAQNSGNQSKADDLSTQALAEDNKAATEYTAYNDLIAKATQLEQLASDREAKARALEAQSKQTSDLVYRKLRESLSKARGELADLKQHQADTRVGRQGMAVRLLISNVHDDALFNFGQGDLNALFQPYEVLIWQISWVAEQDRNYLAAGRMTGDAYCNAAYGHFKDVVINLEGAEFQLVSRGYDTFEADIYKLERQLDKALANEEQALGNSNEGYLQRQADVEAFKQQQGGVRRGMYYDVAKRYRVERNRLAIFRQEWVEEVTAWHDFASKLSKGNDVHRQGALTMDNLVRGWFTKDGANQPESVALFAFAIDSPDRFNTQYGGFDWAKANTFPDIEDAGSPGQLRMQSIMDKLPLLVRSGDDPGAKQGSVP